MNYGMVPTMALRRSEFHNVEYEADSKHGSGFIGGMEFLGDWGPTISALIRFPYYGTVWWSVVMKGITELLL